VTLVTGLGRAASHRLVLVTRLISPRSAAGMPITHDQVAVAGLATAGGQSGAREELLELMDATA
jgi:hypothetical protein